MTPEEKTIQEIQRNIQERLQAVQATMNKHLDNIEAGINKKDQTIQALTQTIDDLQEYIQKLYTYHSARERHILNPKNEPYIKPPVHPHPAFLWEEHRKTILSDLTPIAWVYKYTSQIKTEQAQKEDEAPESKYQLGQTVKSIAITMYDTRPLEGRITKKLRNDAGNAYIIEDRIRNLFECHEDLIEPLNLEDPEFKPNDPIWVKAFLNEPNPNHPTLCAIDVAGVEILVDKKDIKHQ